MSNEGMHFRFPLFIDLSSRRVVVLGGGKIALRRIKVLINFGASVKVITKSALPQILALNRSGKIQLVLKEYEPGDLAGAFIAVAATSSREANKKAGLEAAEKKILISVADSKEESTFWFPAVVNDNNTIAGIVSKRGDSHRDVKNTAAIIRERLEKLDEKDSCGEP